MIAWSGPAISLSPKGAMRMMSDRERWIVYPLLVLSLALGLKTHLSAGGVFHWTSDFDVITCRSLVVKNQLNESKALLHEDEHGAAELLLFGDKGLVEASLSSDAGGGRVLLMRRADQKAIVLGHDKLREISGLWAVEGNSPDSRLISLMIDLENGAAWRLLPWPEPKEKPAEKEEKPAEKKPAEKKPAAEDDASP
jgi:hypothetical protein